ncbi:MAG: hypothetical protein K9N11_06480 [Lentisphaeria bacterium]|nr:hypothetical protein [Candidatus Neomarinimicrobiota bacterium]MCF7842480.1 hypothetical protein [Lentisphaeria bacterium]
MVRSVYADYNLYPHSIFIMSYPFFRKRIYRYWLSLVITTVAAHGQVGTWDFYPAATEVRQMILFDENLYLGTDGGLIKFDPASGNFIQEDLLTRITNLDVRTMHLDQYSRIWLGFSKPGQLIQAVDMATQTVVSVGQLDLDEIVDFASYGDSLFAAYRSGADGGVIYLRNQADDLQYLDLYQNFPPATSAIDRIVSIQVMDGHLILLTEESLLWTDLDLNMKDPGNWQMVNPPQSISTTLNNYFSGAVMLNGALIVAQGSKLYQYDFSQFEEIVPSQSITGNITAIYSGFEGDIHFVNGGNLYSLTLATGETALRGTDLGSRQAVLQTGENEFWLSSENTFLKQISPAGEAEFQPNMPLSRTFNQIKVLEDGVLFGAGREGISMLYPFGWRVIEMADRTVQHDFNPQTQSDRVTDSLNYFRKPIWEDVVQRSDGRLFLSVQGKGVLELDPFDLSTATRYDTTGGVIEIADGHPNYMLPRQLALDSEENVWVTVAFVSDGGQVLTVIRPDGTIRQVHHKADGLSTRLPTAIAIDDYDRVWIGGQYRHNEGDVESSGGLFCLDTRGDLDDEDSFQWAQVLSTNSPGLAGIDIYQLEVDAAGYLWIRSNAGVQYMRVPQNLLTTPELNAYIRSNMSDVVYQLSDFSINRMEIDQRGNRWFLTDQDGVQILQANDVWMNGGYGYNTGNSDIIDDQVYAAGFDAESGMAYVSTGKGLAVLQTPFARPRTDYKTVTIYPQPFRPDKQERVYIQGLMDNSTVKIISISGQVVRELAAVSGEVKGYEAAWDGRDGDGDLVGTGVYLLLYYTENGDSEVGKLAVVR